jgi:hypothetical protein
VGLNFSHLHRLGGCFDFTSIAAFHFIPLKATVIYIDFYLASRCWFEFEDGIE